MFDNLPSSQAPQAKADDIFDGLDQGPAQPQPSQPQAAAFNLEQLTSDQAVQAVPAEENDKTSQRLMLVGAIVIGLFVLAVGVWLSLTLLNKKTATENLVIDSEAQPELDKTAPVPTQTNEVDKRADNQVNGVQANLPDANQAAVSGQTANNPAGISSTGNSAKETEPNKITAPVIPSAAYTDTDNDGLTDGEEAQFGSKPDSRDTDADGLADFEEARIYRSNPAQADSDGDGYTDGAEVKNGYNPNGAGKLLK